MEKDIRNYLHHHLGCECMLRIPHTDEWKRFFVTFKFCLHLSLVKQAEHYSPTYFQLILRPVQSITKEETLTLAVLGGYKKREIKNAGWMETSRHLFFIEPTVTNDKDGFYFFEDHRLNAEQIRYLLQQEFDVFKLIDAGLAIKKEQSLNQKTQV